MSAKGHHGQLEHVWAEEEEEEERREELSRRERRCVWLAFDGRRSVGHPRNLYPATYETEAVSSPSIIVVILLLYRCEQVAAVMAHSQQHQPRTHDDGDMVGGGRELKIERRESQLTLARS